MSIIDIVLLTIGIVAGVGIIALLIKYPPLDGKDDFHQ